MKRTLFIGVVVVAAVFGLVAYATAATSGDVSVTANLRPMLELSVSPATVDFGDVDPGVSYTAAAQPVVTVKSNEVDWSYTEEGIVASSDPDISSFLTEAAVGADTGAVGARGRFERTYEYTLDLTPDAAYTDLDPGAQTATIRYSVTP